MEIENIAMMIVGQLPGRLPVMIALLVGLALVAQRRELAGASRRLALWGFGLLLGINVVGIFVWPLLQAWVIDAAIPASQMGVVFAALSGLMALVDAVGLVLLAFAIVRRAD